MNTVKNQRDSAHLLKHVKHQLPSPGTCVIVLKNLMECYLAWPKHSKTTVHSRAVEEKQDQNTRESEKKGAFTTKMSQNCSYAANRIAEELFLARTCLFLCKMRLTN